MIQLIPTMLKHLVTFFYPKPKDFHYKVSSEVVKEKVNALLTREFSIWDTKDITGSFISENTFVIEVSGQRYGCTLSCEIIPQEDGTTIIRTKAGPSIEYLFFFLSLFAGVTYFYYAVKQESGSYFLWSIACFFVGPVLAIGFSNAAIVAVRERYWMYIHKAMGE